tara:strand:+ start:171 stop:692 length:522 start_codon:yes stop_codon:yes gene_type:complete
MKNIICLRDTEQPLIIEHDKWIFIKELEDIDQHSEHEKLILPFSLWVESVEHQPANRVKAVWLQNDADIYTLSPWLEQLELIALDFPKFTDGRAYSQAVELRTRLKWKGELRATGDVLRDQLSHMHRCGFDSFAIREDKDVFDAIKGISGISTMYSGSVLNPEPLFRRRQDIR